MRSGCWIWELRLRRGCSHAAFLALAIASSSPGGSLSTSAPQLDPCSWIGERTRLACCGAVPATRSAGRVLANETVLAVAESKPCSARRQTRHARRARSPERNRSGLAIDSPVELAEASESTNPDPRRLRSPGVCLSVLRHGKRNARADSSTDGRCAAAAIEQRSARRPAPTASVPFGHPARERAGTAADQGIIRQWLEARHGFARLLPRPESDGEFPVSPILRLFFPVVRIGPSRAGVPGAGAGR